jgi:hypothetical protein
MAAGSARAPRPPAQPACPAPGRCPPARRRPRSGRTREPACARSRSARGAGNGSRRSPGGDRRAQLCRNRGPRLVGAPRRRRPARPGPAAGPRAGSGDRPGLGGRAYPVPFISSRTGQVPASPSPSAAVGQAHQDRPRRAEGDEPAWARQPGTHQVEPVVATQPGQDQDRHLPGEPGADAAALPAAERDPGVAVPLWGAGPDRSRTGSATRRGCGGPGREVRRPCCPRAPACRTRRRRLPRSAPASRPEGTAASWCRITVLSADRTAHPGERANPSTSYQRS